MTKLSDYVVEFLVDHGIQDLFLVSGGGIMHLLDSVGRRSSMRYYCNYHEQACAISAEGFARASNRIGACLVTVGPGAVNALSGVVGAWYDGIPLLVLSGQVRRDLIADYEVLRQRGPQEGNVIAMARPVTKYAETVRDPNSVRQHLEDALRAATTGRPGPVWLEFPLDVQSATIDPEELPSSVPGGPEESPLADVAASSVEVLRTLRSRRRPILIAGNGIHLAGAEELFRQAVDALGIPVVFPESGKDLLPEDHPLNMGILGTAGQRRANFAVQNSDCLVALGAGLSVKKVGFNFKAFAPRAYKIVVDIDPSQLDHQAITPDLGIRADVGRFLSALREGASKRPVIPDPRWTEACRRWKQRYPLVTPESVSDPSHVNSYFFVDRLSDALRASDTLVTGNGLDCVSILQAFKVQNGQRAIISCNWGAMGWDLPLAIGASIGSGRGRTICVTGDGSIQWNIQELLTIRRYALPVKIFVFNNRGYGSIRATQKAFFEGRYVGSDYDSGVANPDFRSLMAAYQIAYDRIDRNDEVETGLARFLADEQPGLCELRIAPEQGISPKASSFRRDDGSLESRPLEDMAPFLSREEVWENMHLFDDEDTPPRR